MRRLLEILGWVKPAKPARRAAKAGAKTAAKASGVAAKRAPSKRSALPLDPPAGVALAPADFKPRQRRRRYEAQVVGESYYQAALEALAGGHREAGHELETWAQLVCDDDNPHDKAAVQVRIDGRQVGNLPRDRCAAYREGLAALGLGKADAVCGALITGGFSERGGGEYRGHFGVRLDLAWPLRRAEG